MRPEPQPVGLRNPHERLHDYRIESAARSACDLLLRGGGLPSGTAGRLLQQEIECLSYTPIRV